MLYASVWQPSGHLPLSAYVLRPLNSYLLKGENQPECQICRSFLTVKHILIDCAFFSAARQRYLEVDTLKELFENVECRNIVAFIKDTNFYHYM